MSTGSSRDKHENGPHGGRMQRWLSVLVILAVIGAFITAAYWALVWSVNYFFNEFMAGINPTLPYTGYTTSMEPADITLVDKQGKPTLALRIPKAYLTNTRTWKGGEHYEVEIQTVLPDMQPLATVVSSPTESPPTA